jgi:O-antigen ligase
MAWVMTQYAWDRRVRMRFFDAYLAGCWLGGLGTLFHYAIGQELIIEAESGFERRYSFGTDPNFLALALVIGVPIACYRAASSRARWKQALFLSYVPAAFAAIVLTGSRGALIALLGSAITFGICTTLRMRVALLIGASICLLLPLALPSSVTSRFLSIPDELSHGTLSGRRNLWDQGTVLVGEHPLLGLGVGATKGALSDPAHNTPLEILIEGGLVSLVLFYGAFAHSIYRLWRGASQDRTLLAVISSGWLIGSLSLSWDVDPITWFIFAMLISACSACESSRGKSRIGEALNVAVSA